ncbi:MAG: Mur ligase domain-containing protein, partial [Dehalococcoidia bacterium]
MIEIRRLASELAEAQLSGGNVRVADICCDSRRATPGSLFVAVPGFNADGHDYIGDALARGAVALAVQASRRDRWEAVVGERGVPTIVVPDTRRALAALA